MLTSIYATQRRTEFSIHTSVQYSASCSFYAVVDLRQDNVLLQMLGDRIPQTLAPQPLVREETVRIPIRAIAQDRHHGVSLAQLLGHLLGSHHVERRAGPQVQSLLIQAAVHHLDALLVADVQRPIKEVNVGLQVLRDTPLPDSLGDTASSSLDKLASALDVAVEHTARRIGQETLDSAVTDSLQIPGDSGQSACRAGRAGKSVDLALRLSPDLGPRRLDVRLPVGCVVELVGPNGIVERLGVSSRLMVVILRIVKRHRRDRVDLRTEQPQQIDLTLRLRVGHVDDQLVALGTADMRQANARVSGRAFNNRSAWSQQSLFLSVFDDIERSSVFHTAAGVLELGFTQDVAPGLLGKALEPDQWRIANRYERQLLIILCSIHFDNACPTFSQAIDEPLRLGYPGVVRGRRLGATERRRSELADSAPEHREQVTCVSCLPQRPDGLQKK